MYRLRTDRLVSKIVSLIYIESVSKNVVVLSSPNYHGNQSCITASDIMTEVNASPPDQRQEVGAVLGRVLYHALLGRCFIGRLLPEESFFLEYVMSRLGSENFTVGGEHPELESSLLQLNPAVVLFKCWLFFLFCRSGGSHEVAENRTICGPRS